MSLDLILKDVVDPVLRENFFRIQRYVAENVLLGPDLRFFQVDIPQTSLAYPIAHGLNFIPRDTILVSAEGDYNFYFRSDLTDKTNIYVAAHGPVRLRFLAGRFNQTGRQSLRDLQVPFVAPNIGQSTGTLSGAGSDGWAFIQDASHPKTNPLQLMANQRVIIPNDALGALTNYENAPANSNSWWDPVANRFWPSKVGEFYTFRLNFRVKPSLNNMNVTLDLDIGTANSVATKTFYLTKGAGNESMFSEPLPTGIQEGAFSNGIGFYIRPDCDSLLYGVNLTVIRDYHL